MDAEKKPNIKQEKNSKLIELYLKKQIKKENNGKQFDNHKN